MEYGRFSLGGNYIEKTHNIDGLKELHRPKSYKTFKLLWQTIYY